MPRLTVARYEENFPGSDYSAEEAEFFKAIDEYKTAHRRPFPSLRELLWVAKAMGYRKVAPAGPPAKPADFHRMKLGG